jgi:phospholipid transport system substrate-binding protein
MNLRYFVFLLSLSLGLIQVSYASDISTTSSVSASQSNIEPYRSFISDLGAKAINTLTDKKLSREERESRFEKMFNDWFAVNAIAKFVLGRYRNQASEQEKQDYLELFKKMIVSTYASRFSQYNNEAFEVLDGQFMDDGGAKVHSHILRPGAPPVSVHWKIYKDKNNALKIIDVIVENVSMSMTQRSEFSSIIQKNGGKVSDLNRVLKQKLEAKQDLSKS